MEPELSRRLARAVNVIRWATLEDRYAFVDRVENAKTFDDLDHADQIAVLHSEAIHPADAPLTH